MAVAMQLLLPLYTGQPSAIFRPMFPQPPTVTTPAAILAALQAVQATTAFTVPSIIESWIHDQDALKYLSTLDQLVRLPFILPSQFLIYVNRDMLGVH